MIKLQKGDTVRLAQIMTQDEFGLALYDDEGAVLEIDGVVIEAVPHTVNARIKQPMHQSRTWGQQRERLAVGCVMKRC
mgnify:CR=1 FL=1